MRDWIHLVCGLSGHTLKRKQGAHGSFYGCSHYPECGLTIDAQQVDALRRALEAVIVEKGAAQRFEMELEGSRSVKFCVIQESDEGVTVQAIPVRKGKGTV